MVAIARRISQADAMPTDPGYGAEERHTQVLFSDWTPQDLKPHLENVEVYSNCKQVELFLNGKSLGKKAINADASPRNWQVSFTPGTLKAVAWNGKSAVTNVLRTAGKPVRIVLATRHETLSPDWDDVAEVRATIVDANGLTIPRANNLISLQDRLPARASSPPWTMRTMRARNRFKRRRAMRFRAGVWRLSKLSEVAERRRIALTATRHRIEAGKWLILWTSPEVSQ